MSGETITVLVDDWDAALRAEHDEIVRARGGRPLTSDELAAWLRAVEKRNRAHAQEADEPADDDALLERRVRLRGTAVELRLPTLAARIRLQAVDRWLAEGRVDGRTALVLSAYCLAHGHDAAALGRIFEPAAARWEALRWGGSELTCASDEEIVAARARLFDGVYDRTEAGDPDDPKARTPAGPGSPHG